MSGHDVLTAYEDQKANKAISDENVLLGAGELRRAVLTLDRIDFKRLHEQTPNHTGIVVCTTDPDHIGQARRISLALQASGNLEGQLIRVYRPS